MWSFKKNIYRTRREDSVAPCEECIAHNVDINGQIWTGCNAGISTYRDLTVIPQVQDPTDWENLTTGAWCYYDNDPTNDAIYGKLYNWYAIAGVYDAASLANPLLRKQFAPLGYHIPTDAEWTVLTDYLGGLTIAGGKLKETGLCHWATPNTDATNTSLFTALPGGYRFYNGYFFNVGRFGFWWSSTEYGTSNAWYRLLSYSDGIPGRSNGSKTFGLSVRFIKD